MSSLLKSPLVAGGRTIGPDTSYKIMAGLDPDGEPILLALDADGAISVGASVGGATEAKQVGATNVSIVRATSTGTAATLIVARATRKGALIRNLDTANSVWIGPATVTTSNGFLIKAGEALPITWVGLVQIIDDTNHAAVTVLDEYY